MWWPWKSRRISAEVNCYLCGKMIYIGDKVEWLRVGGRNYLEHKDCAA